MGYRIAIVGATGNVGREVLDILSERGFPADEVVPLKAQGFDRDAALRGLPPLLRSYLAMGGWVSDHAVVDRDLNTLHVFTAVEISSIPAERAETLRAVGRV